MWARTLCPLLSSTRNIALGRASTTVPSISITPSFFGMSSTIRCLFVYRRPANLPAGAAGWVDLMRPSVAPRSPGTRVTVTLNDVAGVPGSREAPRDGPMLGRLFSLVRGGSETESSSGSAGQQPQGLLAGRAARRIRALVGGGHRVDHHLVHAVRRRQALDLGAGRVGVTDDPARPHGLDQRAVGVRDIDLLGLLDQELG